MKVEDLDHPILFVFFAMLAIVGMQSLVTWGAKALGLIGLSELVQHP